MAARRRPSRLARTRERKYTRNAVVFTLLGIGTVIAILFVGLPILARVIIAVSEFTGQGGSIKITDNTPPPPPRFDDLPDFTADDRLRVSGSTEAGATVIITFNGAGKELVASADGTFSTTFELVDGVNTLSAVAHDAAGNESARSPEVVITKDTEPPELEIITPEDGERFSGSAAAQIAIEGQTEKGVSARINDRVAIVNREGKFKHPVTLTEGENEYRISATDEAGNETEITLTIIFSP